jgi:hypothetical protein
MFETWSLSPTAPFVTKKTMPFKGRSDVTKKNVPRRGKTTFTKKVITRKVEPSTEKATTTSLDPRPRQNKRQKQKLLAPVVKRDGGVVKYEFPVVRDENEALLDRYLDCNELNIHLKNTVARVEDEIRVAIHFAESFWPEGDSAKRPFLKRLRAAQRLLQSVKK